MSKNKTEDMVKYRQKYYEEHKEDYRQTEICDICSGSYQIWNKSAHKRSKKHKQTVEILKMKNDQIKLQQELDELKNKITH